MWDSQIELIGVVLRNVFTKGLLGSGVNTAVMSWVSATAVELNNNVAPTPPNWQIKVLMRFMVVGNLVMPLNLRSAG